MNKSQFTLSRLILLGFATSLFLAPVVLSTQDQDEIRELGRTDWQKERAKARGNPLPHTRVNPIYKVKEKMPQTALASQETGKAELGLTIWRLRPSTKTDAVEIKDLIQPPGSVAKQEMTMERVESAAELSEGQIVRLTIESLREGYLYVINRPRYADGSYGDPYLIFPTQRMYGGNNKVKAGKSVQIPGDDSEPNYFELRRGSREGELQVSEELIIIVKLEPFEAFKTAPADRKLLTSQSVEALLTKYKTARERSEMKDGVGRAITIGEKKASKDLEVQLAEDDPYPQTIFRLAAKPTDPLLVDVQLKVRGK